jgi:hypothetical protein
MVLLPTHAYFDLTGDVAQQNVLGARAFVPWDAVQQHFAFDSPVMFPHATRLYDHTRFEAAHKSGKVSEVGPVRVQVPDRYVRAIELQAGPNAQSRAAVLTYPGVWLPPGAAFQASISLHPRTFSRPDVGIVHVELRVSTPGGDRVVAEQTLDPMDRGRQVFLPFDADLSAAGGQTVDLSIRAWVADSAPADALDVLIGEPRLRMP